MYTDTPDQDSGAFLERLHRAVYMAIRNKLGSQASPEQIERITRKILSEMREPPVVAWDLALPTTTQAVKRTAMLNRVVRIAGHVAELRDPQVITVPAPADGGAEAIQVETTCARIEGRDGPSIWSLDVTGADLIGKLQAVGSEFVEFLGLVIAVPVKIDTKRPDASLGDASDFPSLPT